MCVCVCRVRVCVRVCVSSDTLVAGKECVLLFNKRQSEALRCVLKCVTVTVHLSSCTLVRAGHS